MCKPPGLQQPAWGQAITRTAVPSPVWRGAGWACDGRDGTCAPCSPTSRASGRSSPWTPAACRRGRGGCRSGALADRRAIRWRTGSPRSARRWAPTGGSRRRSPSRGSRPRSSHRSSPPSPCTGCCRRRPRRRDDPAIGPKHSPRPSPRPCTGAPAVPARGCGGRATRAGSCRARTVGTSDAAHRRARPGGRRRPGTRAGRGAGAVGQRRVGGGECPAAGRRRPPRRRPARRRGRPAPARDAAARGHGDVAAPRTRPTSGGPSGAARAVCSTASPAVGSAATACCAGPAANAAPPTGAHRTPPRLATKPAGGGARVLLRRPPGRWSSPQRVRGRDPRCTSSEECPP